MKPLLIFLCALLVPLAAAGDAGLLIPRDKAQPDPAILSLEEMEITIRIADGDARVFVKQIFSNHTSGIEEGNYVFALPSLATVSDFAVWDGPTRIPAVILERKRAEEIYNQLRQQSIDPGLLQMGERGSEEAKRSTVFSARIVPIPAYGTKRLEFEYHQAIPVENRKAYFTLPLRPDAYQAQTARHLRIHFQLHSALPIANFQAPAKSFPLVFRQNGPHLVEGILEAENVNLAEDFVATFEQSPEASDTAQVLTYRDPEGPAPSPTENAPVARTNEPGFFEVEALLGTGTAASIPSSAAPGPPEAAKTLIILFDISLSMQWEKLERSYRALESLLHSLKPADRFNLLLFNSQVQAFQPQPVPADPAAVQHALDFVRASKLRGGTNLQAALEAALRQDAGNSSATYLILLSDGGATRGSILNVALAARYSAKWKKLPESVRPHTFIFGVGDDANLPLLRMLARSGGLLEQVLSTEPLEFKLNAFLSKIGRAPLDRLRLDAPADITEMVYPLQETVYPGSVAGWVGRYSQPRKNVTFTVRGNREGAPVTISGAADLPARSLENSQLPRLWARVRVDALLEKIEREGEDQASIDEIIRLAREYKFVTPYTSFLAVPRALLRPRVIRPGDPVLRVKTEGSFASVVALFPFGLVQPLRYLAAEDVWETRFYAPGDMQDGTYTVRLILRDPLGHTYRESKTFVIASKPPVIRIHLERTRFRRAEAVELKVSASSGTRTLVARLPGAAPAELRWDPRAGACRGILFVPEQAVPGIYKLTVTGEDIAHNIASQGVDIEILP